MTGKKLKESVTAVPEKVKTYVHRLKETAPVLFGIVLAAALFGGFWSSTSMLSSEPAPFDLQENAEKFAKEYAPHVFSEVVEGGNQPKSTFATGHVTVSTLIRVTEHLWDKPGGYMSNDILPPFAFGSIPLLDNIQNWELGVLRQVRDFTFCMRDDLTRSQSQSTEDKDLVAADTLLRNESTKWIFPSAEGRYKKASTHLRMFLKRMNDVKSPDAQFYPRADNLVDWLALISKNLGSMSQRLTASVGQDRVNQDNGSTPTPDNVRVKTPWMEIDDVFYQARGTCWALLHLIHAVEIDFKDVLEKKNAIPSIRQITRELHATQQYVWSLMILNGSGFGPEANHSLVLSSYMTRANAAILDLQRLLKDG